MSACVRIVLVLALVCLSSACRGRQPALMPSTSLETHYRIRDLEIVGPTEGRSTRVRVLGIGFGPSKSFLDAELAALANNDSELLIDRVRYTGRTGIVIPIGTLLQLLFTSFPEVDVPIFTREIWSVQGLGARYRPVRATRGTPEAP